jgi:beta-glucosidase
MQNKRHPDPFREMPQAAGRGKRHVMNAVLCCAVPLSACTAPPPMSDGVDARAAELVSRMTLEEKVGQLNFCRISVEGIEDLVRQGKVGGLLNVRDHAKRKELEKLARAESRMGVPLLHCGDVIHGYRTQFPIPLALASAWDPKLVEEVSRIAAREATATANIRLNFSPMVDLTRDPRWGRIAEGFGEDAYLTGILGAAMVEGYQGKNLADPTAMAACVKHFAGYGASEGGRDYNTADVSDQRMANYYLAPFQTCVEQGAAAIMPAFTSLNGVPVSAEARLLRGVLREQWGFQGLTISDAKAVSQLVPHGFAKDEKQAAARAIEGGMDVEIISTSYLDHLAALVESGAVPVALVDEAATRVVALKFRLGLFGDPAPHPQEEVLAPDALQLARDSAARSVVLLKNEGGLLPFDDSKLKFAVVGSLAQDPKEQLGTWMIYGRAEDSVTPLAALTERLGADRIHAARVMKNSRDTSTNGIAAAVKAAAQSDVILWFAGEDGLWTGEAKSRSSLVMPGAQRELFAALRATGKPLVMVLVTGRPLEIGDMIDDCAAVVLAWHGGTLAGPGLVDVLFGDVNPSGKLPLTWPRVTGQIPVNYDHENTGRPARDLSVAATNLNQPDTSHVTGYIDLPGSPQFPFGYGLSYTTFEYSDVKIAKPSWRPTEVIRASATIRNAGDVEGTEIVQLYTRQLVGSLTRPVRQLRRFQRVDLKPGESKVVEFELPAEDLSYYLNLHKRILEPGDFMLWIAPDARSGVAVPFSIEKQA